MTPQTPTYPRSDNPEMIPQTPPMDQNNKKTHSPITLSTTKEDASRRPVKDMLGLRQEYVQDETPRRPVKDRLGTRRSKRNTRPFDPFKRGCAPPRSSEFSRETWDQDQAGYWYPSKTKTVMMNWEMLNPQMRRDNKNRNLQLK